MTKLHIKLKLFAGMLVAANTAALALSTFNSSGAMRITGLPLPVSQMIGAVNLDPASILSSYAAITLTAGQLPSVKAIAGQSRLDLYLMSDTGTATLGHTLLSASTTLQAQIIYITT